MVSAKATIVNPQGMHMRPARLLAEAMAPYPCRVVLAHRGGEADAKSMMQLMAACIKQGDQVEIRCDGPREAEALERAAALIAAGLGD